MSNLDAPCTWCNQTTAEISGLECENEMLIQAIKDVIESHKAEIIILERKLRGCRDE